MTRDELRVLTARVFDELAGEDLRGVLWVARDGGAQLRAALPGSPGEGWVFVGPAVEVLRTTVVLERALRRVLAIEPKPAPAPAPRRARAPIRRDAGELGRRSALLDALDLVHVAGADVEPPREVRVLSPRPGTKGRPGRRQPTPGRKDMNVSESVAGGTDEAARELEAREIEALAWEKLRTAEILEYSGEEDDGGQWTNSRGVRGRLAHEACLVALRAIRPMSARGNLSVSGDGLYLRAELAKGFCYRAAQDDEPQPAVGRAACALAAMALALADTAGLLRVVQADLYGVRLHAIEAELGELGARVRALVLRFCFVDTRQERIRSKFVVKVAAALEEIEDVRRAAAVGPDAPPPREDYLARFPDKERTIVDTFLEASVPFESYDVLLEQLLRGPHAPAWRTDGRASGRGAALKTLRTLVGRIRGRRELLRPLRFSEEGYGLDGRRPG